MWDFPTNRHKGAIENSRLGLAEGSRALQQCLLPWQNLITAVARKCSPDLAHPHHTLSSSWLNQVPGLYALIPERMIDA